MQKLPEFITFLSLGKPLYGSEF